MKSTIFLACVYNLFSMNISKRWHANIIFGLINTILAIAMSSFYYKLASIIKASSESLRQFETSTRRHHSNSFLQFIGTALGLTFVSVITVHILVYMSYRRDASSVHAWDWLTMLCFAWNPVCNPFIYTIRHLFKAQTKKQRKIPQRQNDS